MALRRAGPVNDVAPNITELAGLLLLPETRESDSLDAVVNAGEHTWNRLERQLTALVGPAGFDALSTRALALARVQHPVLVGFNYGTVQGERLVELRERGPEYAASSILAALVSLLAHFLAVFIRLIGVDLVLHLVREAWPELPSEATPPMLGDA